MANASQDGGSATQASVVPFRFVESELEFCLITTRRSNRWGFPKGRIGREETVVEAALEEAWEEAGLRGRIVGDPVGGYHYRKQNQDHSVIVMLMQVDDSEDEWKESGERQRVWVPLDEAARLLDRPNLMKLLKTAAARLGRVTDEKEVMRAVRA